MEFKIEGSERDVKKFLKMNALFMKRNSLKVVSEENKEEELKLNANQVAELISKVGDLEGLKEFESDARQVVKLAYNKKLKELE